MEKVKLALLAMVAVGVLMFGVAQLLESRYYYMDTREGTYTETHFVLDRWTGEVVVVHGAERVRIPLGGGTRVDAAD